MSQSSGTCVCKRCIFISKFSLRSMSISNQKKKKLCNKEVRLLIQLKHFSKCYLRANISIETNPTCTQTLTTQFSHIYNLLTSKPKVLFIIINNKRPIRGVLTIFFYQLFTFHIVIDDLNICFLWCIGLLQPIGV